MCNVFLVVRTIFFALLTYIYVLVLIFASWNIAAATSFGISTPGASVFLLMISIFIFVLVLVAYLAEIICPKARPAQARFECAWTAMMSILQLAASVDVTVNGPPIYCHTHSSWAMCASSSLLVHISWLATLTIFSYCLTICVASATHATSLPDIWITPIPHVPWFRPDVDIEAPVPATIPHLPARKPLQIPSSPTSVREASCAVSKYLAERWEKLSHISRHPTSSGPILFNGGRQSADPNRPTWARQYRVRRGVDDPFAKPLPPRKEPPVTVVLPPPPPRTHSRQVVVSRDSSTVDGSEPRGMVRTLSSSTLPSRTPSMFPQKITNPDLPIPRPNNMSEWVRADALSWISASTERTSSSLW
ncbi:hypothetical protein L210DRAFT_3526814 [Boletus edulis BED1]|uniref:Transmembrane protein n=1 Tax=Boletus edulis BED1 TaxID=1328754 RepID=A0AAD4C3M4_BOLED|nr:hypothetical protein L210DRAFT_3526814 [Boletus edulis BED1]